MQLDCTVFFCVFRLIQNSLLSLVGAVGINDNKSAVDKPKRSPLIRSVLKRLTMADASNFYNLASLESSVFTLLRLTSRYVVCQPYFVVTVSYSCSDF